MSMSSLASGAIHMYEKAVYRPECQFLASDEPAIRILSQFEMESGRSCGCGYCRFPLCRLPLQIEDKAMLELLGYHRS